MIKKILKKIFLVLFRLKNSRFASIGDRCVFGLRSRLINRTGDKDRIVIKNDVMMHGSLIVEGDGRIELADFVNIRRETYIGSSCRVTIGAGVIISNNVVIMDNNNHPVSPEARRAMVSGGWSTDRWSWKHSASAPIVIHENVWIGQGARINKGVEIGRNSIIAANAVVTKSVPSNSIAAGNPARIVKTFSETL